MRQLLLHASALSDAEYDLYTSSLNDLAWTDEADTTATHDDAYYDKMKLGVREARGWLKGRYSHVSPADIDVILRFFSPNLNHTDQLSGGQFFAALRLVVHAETGKTIDRGLAFVQAHPDPTQRSRPPSPNKQFKTGVPPVPRNDSHTVYPAPTTFARTSEDPRPNPFTPTSPPSSTEPYSQSQSYTSSRHDLPKPPPPNHTAPHTTHNPFVNRTPKSPPNEPPVKLPPLPPRKPPPPIPTQSHPVLLPPPRHGLLSPTGRKSVSPSRAISTPGMTTPLQATTNSPANHPPPAPKSSHVTSNLMKQSLQASKAAQTMKKAEEQLEQERVMQILKSSSVVSGGYSLAGASVSSSSVVIGTNIHNRSTSPTKVIYPPPSTTNSSSYGSADDRAPPLPRRRTQQQQPSPPVSVSSLEEVALAAANSQQVYQGQPTVPSFHSPRPTLSQYTPPSIGSRPLPNPSQSTYSTGTIHTSPRLSPSPPSVDLPQPPCQPPTHPNRKPSYHTSSSTFSASSSSSYRTSDTHTDNNDVSSGSFHGSNFNQTHHYVSTDPQPQSPFRNPNPSTPEGSPTARVFRSKSLHHPSPPLPPIPPPPRRKRPESVQVLGSGEIIFGGTPRAPDSVSDISANSGYRPSSNLSRHASLSSPGTHRRSSLSMSSNPPVHPQHQHNHDMPTSLSNIQRTIATLQPKLDALQLQPRLEKARYKAEAGISRRGFMRDGGRSGSRGRGEEGEEKEELIEGGGNGIMRERGRVLYDYDAPGVDGINTTEVGVDSDETGDGIGDGDGEREWRRITRERWGGKEKDELKWPAGEGWRPL